MKSAYLLFLSIAVPVMAQTQRLSFGVQGGMPVQTPLGQTDDQMPFAVGPIVNIRILPRLSLETGVLFHRMGQDQATGAFLYPQDAISLTHSQQRAHAVEVPVLAKYYVLPGRRPWRPFISLGPTFRRTSLDSQYESTIFSGSSLNTLPVFPGLNTKRVDWHVDPVLGVGVDVRTGRFHLAPEVRYSYWGAGVNMPVRKNQIDCLLGFRF
jgi:hypothetical protein